MPWLADLLTTQFLVFTLALARVGGFVVTAPLYSAVAVPVQIRVLLAIALAALVAPTQLADSPALPATLVSLLVAIGFELLVGLALGLGTAILLAGAQLAGQLIAQMSGLSLAEVFDPGLDANVPVLAHLLHLFAVAMYLAIGGHRWLMAGLLDTFAALPLASASFSASLPDALITLTSESFSLAIRAAAPAAIAVLLATLVLGLVSRTLPQLNIMSVGFGLNTFVAFAALALSLGTTAWLLEEQLQPAVTIVRDAIELPGLTDK
jgi:flagellar biosynthetic protein FliR